MTQEGNEHAEAETPEVAAPAVPVEPERGEAETGDVDPETENDVDPEGDPDPDAEGAAEGAEDTKHLKFTAEQQAAFDRAMARKQRKLREAREKTAKAEEELESLRAERDALNSKVGDDAVLRAMNMAGILPDYVTASEAKLIHEAETLKASKRFLKGLVRKGEEYSGLDANGNQRTWTPEELDQQLDRVEDRLEVVGGRAGAIRARIVEEYREDCRVGREARKNGGRTRRTEAGAGKPPARKPADVAPPLAPAGGGESRRDPARDSAAGVDWSKVNTPEDMERALAAEERARRRR